MVAKHMGPAQVPTGPSRQRHAARATETPRHVAGTASAGPRPRRRRRGVLAPVIVALLALAGIVVALRGCGPAGDALLGRTKPTRAFEVTTGTLPLG